MRLLAGSSIAIIGHTLISGTHALPYVTDSGLSIDTMYKVECSRKTQQGDTVHVHYNGTLTDGTTFDSSYSRNNPIAFKLGMGQVIRGWDEGLMDMCIGEERLLTIPPELGYGSRGVGPIPANSVLVFGTKLVSIDGVPKDQDPLLPPPTPSLTAAPTTATSSIHSTTLTTSTTTTTSSTTPASSTTSATSPPTAIPTDGSKPGAEAGECRLLGPFALFVQGGLGILALLSLVLKRYRESPRRPVKVWAFDASKQILGSMLLHVLNLIMSMLGTGDVELNTPDVIALSAQLAAQGDGSMPNPCSFYLINLAIDTTIGIPILVILLGLLGHGAALTPLANPPESLRSGNYGHPPRFTWWLKQALIYFIGLLLMKLCVYFIFQLLPWIAWVGDWCLRWTEGSETLQIVFVMFIFPVCMNALQYYIIDSYIKDPAGGTHMPVATSDRSSDDPRDDDDDDDDTAYASEQEVDVEGSNAKVGKGKGDAGVKAKEIGSQLEGADERDTAPTSSSNSSKGGK